MTTIQAKVNSRLLAKANRLFTGTLQGRIIEILQNARRAGATQVDITNLPDGTVRVRDNGQGVSDFSKLLDLGGSGWDSSMEKSEDPAGVGLFCLAPREVTIQSIGRKITIRNDGWTGEPIEIEDDAETLQGTVLLFQDEPWTPAAVDPNAVFCGMQVTVDGVPCPREAFLSDQAASYPELGCRIEVREQSDCESWHRSCVKGSWYSENVLVNFHGQTVSFAFQPLGQQHLHFLIELTGEPTGIRLMLPARTRLVENPALNDLKVIMELEAYRYLQRRGHHRLPYQEYVRAGKLGITLPEATPVFQVGLLHGDSPEPIEVVMPEKFPLSKCYRLNPDCLAGDETDEANVHLLAALGTLAEPFMPVDIRSEYDGYSWAKLPTIERVEFQAGAILHESWLWSGKIACVDQLQITAYTSDGRSFASSVCMGIPPIGQSEKDRYREETVYVTREAQEIVPTWQIWFHFGGWCDEGDTYDTQEHSFTEELDRFWALLIGPDEQLRRNLIAATESIDRKWKAVTISSNGSIGIQFKNGSRKKVRPPAR